MSHVGRDLWGPSSPTAGCAQDYVRTSCLGALSEHSELWRPWGCQGSFPVLAVLRSVAVFQGAPSTACIWAVFLNMLLRGHVLHVNLPAWALLMAFVTSTNEMLQTLCAEVREQLGFVLSSTRASPWERRQITFSEHFHL